MMSPICSCESSVEIYSLSWYNHHMKSVSNAQNVRLALCLLLIVIGSSVGFTQGSRGVAYPLLNQSDIFTIALEPSDDDIVYHPFLITDNDSQLVSNGLYEGLFAYDPVDAKPVPAMASNVRTNEDGTIWTITLKESLVFSNGDAITSRTFIDSWMAMLSYAKEGLPMASVSLFDAVKGARDYRSNKGPANEVALKAPDENTVVIELDYPVPYLPQILAMPAYAPVHPSERPLTGRIDPVDKIVPGPYVIAEVDNGNILLKKNQRYWDYYGTKSDYIRIIRNMSSEEIATAYREGAIDWSAAFIPLQNVADKRDLRLAAQYSTAFFYFSATDGPYADSAVRRMLVDTIDWPAIRSSSGQLFPTDRLIPSLERMQATSVSPESVPEIPDVSAGLPVLNIAIHRGAQIEEITHSIAERWSTLFGITVVLDVVPLGIYASSPNTSPYQFAGITWIGDFESPYAFLHMWLSDNPYNLSNFSDQTYDELLFAALAADTESLRSSYFQKAEQYLIDQGIVIPLYHGLSSNFVVTERVEGWYANLLDIHPLKHLKVVSENL